MRIPGRPSIAACNIEQNFSPEVQTALDTSVQEIGLSQSVAGTLHRQGLHVVRDVLVVGNSYLERIGSMSCPGVDETARKIKDLGVPIEMRRTSLVSHLAHFCGSLATIGATAFVGRVVDTGRPLTVREPWGSETQRTFTAVDVLEKRLPGENPRNFGWFYPRYKNVDEFYDAHMDEFQKIAAQFDKEHDRLQQAGLLPENMTD